MVLSAVSIQLVLGGGLKTVLAGTIIVDRAPQEGELAAPELALKPIQMMGALDAEASARLREAKLPDRVVRLWRDESAIEEGLDHIFRGLDSHISRQDSYPKHWRERMRTENGLIADIIEYPELYRLVKPELIEECKLVLACLGTLKIVAQEDVCRLWRGLKGR
jgi:hypothetical protein